MCATSTRGAGRLGQPTTLQAAPGANGVVGTLPAWSATPNTPHALSADRAYYARRTANAFPGACRYIANRPITRSRLPVASPPVRLCCWFSPNDVNVHRPARSTVSPTGTLASSGTTNRRDCRNYAKYVIQIAIIRDCTLTDAELYCADAVRVPHSSRRGRCALRVRMSDECS